MRDPTNTASTNGRRLGPAPHDVACGEPQHRGGLITADEVARLLGVPVTWVYEQSRQGAIPTVRPGRYRCSRRREGLQRAR
jgi:excisionase family DNA binding protein